MASADGYPVQQCAAVATVDGADAVQDVVLTSRENLTFSSSYVPLGAPATRTISGVVFEVVDDGERAIEGVWVGWDTGETVNDQQVVAAWTFTDANGRYLLCGLPETPLTLTAYEANFRQPVRTHVAVGSDALFDIELVHK
jgi:hypothetical protein